MAVDLGDLLRLLHEDPEQRAALRRALLGDDADVFSALGNLVEEVRLLAVAQRRTEERLDALAEAQRRTEERLDALAGDVRSLAEAQHRTEERLDALAEAQRSTERSLASLIDTVKGMHDRLAKLDGQSLERGYREKGHAYLSGLARRLRFLDSNTLSSMVDDAESEGTLTPYEATSILLADAVFAGRRRSDKEPVHLVVEASVTIDRHDVRRARERADLLARLVGTPVMAVAAGELAPEPVVDAAREADVWIVTNGRAVGPDDDPEDSR